MGNRPSSASQRVRPSLYPSSNNNRLSSSSFSDSKQPLPISNPDEIVEQRKCEIEAQRRKIESLEIKNEALEKNVAALGKQVLELKSAISRLQSTCSQPGPSEIGSDTSLLKQKVETLELRIMKINQDTATGVKKTAESDNQVVELAPIHQTMPIISSDPSEIGSDTSLLKQKVETLELRIMKVELDPLMTQINQDTATGVKKTAESDKQVVELAPIHQTMPIISSVSDHLATPVEEGSGNQGQNSTDDLVGILIVLIFLVTVLIGLNL